MATNEIDKLEINVKVSGLTQKSIDNVNALTKALEKLNKTVSNVDGLKKYADSLSKVSNAIKTVGSTSVSRTLSGKNVLQTKDVSKKPSGGSLPKVATIAETSQKSLSGFGQWFKKTSQEINESSEKITRNFETMTHSARESAEVFEQFGKSDFERSLDKAKRAQESLGDFGKWFKTTSKEISENSGGIAQNFETMTHSAEESAQVFEQFGKTDFEKELDKLEEKTKNVSIAWSKLLRAIGRIALYRTIRRALQMITQAMREGFQNYAQYSNETNVAFSNIKNSVGQLKNTFGVTLGYLIQALAPAIETLSNAIIGIVDSLNMAIASMNGMNGTYSKAIKQNEDYAKSLQKTNKQLLSFDKFESLKSGNGSDSNPANMFEESSVSEDWNDTATFFKFLIDSLKAVIPILKTIFQILSKLSSATMTIVAPLLEIVDEILIILMPSIETLMDIISPIFDEIAGGLKMVGGLLKLLNGDVDGFIENFANGFAKMINGIVNIFISFVNACIDGLNFLLAPIDWIVKLFGGKGLNIKHLEWKMNWQPYANGGMLPNNVGSLAVMGEAGAEVVAQGSRGTGVTNIEQFTTAMYNALTMYGVARSADVKINGEVVMNSTKVGQIVERSVYNEGVRVGHFSRNYGV